MTNENNSTTKRDPWRELGQINWTSADACAKEWCTEVIPEDEGTRRTQNMALGYLILRQDDERLGWLFRFLNNRQAIFLFLVVLFETAWICRGYAL